jgi:tripartite-type tricarboxylate transporter receptor subunit TctC
MGESGEGERSAGGLMKPFRILAIFLCLCASALAQEYPTKPIRLIAPFAPGGPTDLFARLMGAKLGERLGQPVLVENRPGAGGSVGAEVAAKAAPDGYTLVLVSSSFAVNATLYPKLPYDTLRDFAPVTLLASAPFLLVAHTSVPASNVRELIALAKAKPGALNYGSGGSGSGPHIVAELFKSQAGVDIVHIPYKGTGPLIAALVAGDVQLAFGNMFALVPQVKSGRLRAIAVTGRERSSALPEVPTVAESGLPGFEAVGVHGLLAPAETPRRVIDKLNAECVAILRSPEVRSQLASDGAEPVGNTPEQYAAQIAAEMQKWGKLIVERGIRAD